MANQNFFRCHNITDTRDRHEGAGERAAESHARQNVDLETASTTAVNNLSNIASNHLLGQEYSDASAHASAALATDVPYANTSLNKRQTSITSLGTMQSFLLSEGIENILSRPQESLTSLGFGSCTSLGSLVSAENPNHPQVPDNFVPLQITTRSVQGAPPTTMQAKRPRTKWQSIYNKGLVDYRAKTGGDEAPTVLAPSAVFRSTKLIPLSKNVQLQQNEYQPTNCHQTIPTRNNAKESPIKTPSRVSKKTRRAKSPGKTGKSSSRREVPYNERDYSIDQDRPGEMDVICGRGGEANHHPGNKRFWWKVLKVRSEYKACSNTEKDKKNQLAWTVVEFVKQNGCFLDRDSEKKIYRVPDWYAIDKAKQALRDKYVPFFARKELKPARGRLK